MPQAFPARLLGQAGGRTSATPIEPADSSVTPRPGEALQVWRPDGSGMIAVIFVLERAQPRTHTLDVAD